MGDYREGLPLTEGIEEIARAADDFGHTVHRVPDLVGFPADANAVAGIARYARDTGRTLVPRGSGHSVFGQAQSDGGITCDLTRLHFAAVEDKESIRAGAGTRWSRMLDAALACGLTPPVLPDYLELTAGGVLSVGGIGGTSHRYGPVVDHVRSLDVVTPAGEREVCSASRNPRLFSAVLGTGGNGGIITSAAFPLVPAPERVRVYQVPHPSVGTLVASQTKAVGEGRTDYIEGQILLGEDGNWEFLAELGVYSVGGQPGGDPALDARVVGEDMTYRDFCHRMAPGVRLLAATGDWYRPHPWLSVFLPADAVEQYVNTALAELTPATVGPIPMLLYPLRRGVVPAPGLATPGRDELFFAFSILRTTATAGALAEALASNERLARAATAVGGTVYRISAIPPSQAKSPAS